MKRGLVLFAAAVIISLLCITAGVYSDSLSAGKAGSICGNNNCIAGNDQGGCPNGTKCPGNCQGDKKCSSQDDKKCPGNCQGDKKCNCSSQSDKKCNCGCNCQGKCDGKCGCPNCKCKSATCGCGKKCTCGSDCKCGPGCQCGGNCKCGSKCSCAAMQVKCPCGGSCSCCDKCECGTKCVCAGTCVCCDKCKCVIPGAGFLSGQPHMDGPNLVIENDNHRTKTVIVTGNTLFYPQNLDIKKVKRVNVHYTIRTGLSQALEVYDAKYSWIARDWDQKNKRYHYYLAKKKI